MSMSSEFNRRKTLQLPLNAMGLAVNKKQLHATPAAAVYYM